MPMIASTMTKVVLMMTLTGNGNDDQDDDSGDWRKINFFHKSSLLAMLLIADNHFACYNLLCVGWVPLCLLIKKNMVYDVR